MRWTGGDPACLHEPPYEPTVEGTPACHCGALRIDDPPRGLPVAARVSRDVAMTEALQAFTVFCRAATRWLEDA